MQPKSAQSSLMDAGRRREALGSETKDHAELIAVYRLRASRFSTLSLVP